MIPNLVAGGNRYRRLFYCYPLSSARLWECWCRPPSAAQPRTRCDSPLPETAAVQRRICPVVCSLRCRGPTNLSSRHFWRGEGVPAPNLSGFL